MGRNLVSGPVPLKLLAFAPIGNASPLNLVPITARPLPILECLAAYHGTIARLKLTKKCFN